jgi:hypothetical protein
VFFSLVQLAVHRTQHIFHLAADHLGSHAPGKGKLIALTAIKVPVLYRPKQASHKEVRVFLASIGHNNKENCIGLLMLSGVAVEKHPLLKKPSQSRDRKCPPKSGTSFIGHLSAMKFLRISRV